MRTGGEGASAVLARRRVRNSLRICCRRERRAALTSEQCPGRGDALDTDQGRAHARDGDITCRVTYRVTPRFGPPRRVQRERRFFRVRRRSAGGPACRARDGKARGAPTLLLAETRFPSDGLLPAAKATHSGAADFAALRPQCSMCV